MQKQSWSRKRKFARSGDSHCTRILCILWSLWACCCFKKVVLYGISVLMPVLFRIMLIFAFYEYSEFQVFESGELAVYFRLRRRCQRTKARRLSSQMCVCLSQIASIFTSYSPSNSIFTPYGFKFREVFLGGVSTNVYRSLPS